MPDSRPSNSRATQGASFNWPLVRKRCEQLGAKTNIQAALLIGLSPRTLDGLRTGHRDTRLSAILKTRQVLGLSLDDMFPADDQAA